MEDCIFCSIAARTANSTVVYEDEHSLAFLDIIPLNPGHTLVIPKRHYPSMNEMPPEEVGRLFVSVAKVMRGVRKASKADGINIGQSNGRAASQEVFHIHVHIIPRYNNDSQGGLTFPERKKMQPQDMEAIGKQIRQAIKSEN